MKKIISLFLLFSFWNFHAQESYSKALLLMGCNFEITVVANTPEEGDKYINIAIQEIQRIEKLISSWDEDSQTSAINKNAGKSWVKVPQELFDLISRSQKISKLTEGAFDISYASIDQLWHYDGSMTRLPSAKAIQQSIAKIGWYKIEMDAEQLKIKLPETGMKIGFGAIGKGYAADKAKALLVKMGVVGGIINASGDMNCWGTQPNGKDWKVAITNPLNKGKAFAYFPILNSAVVTSGNYEKYIEINNQRYTHIIDPRTGYPTTELISCTVFAPKAELADALATSIFVMGKESGLFLINQLPNIECILVDAHGNIFYSKHIKTQQIKS